METLVAVRFEKFAIVAASQQENFHFIQLRDDTEKVHEVAPRKLMGILGSNAYRTKFTEYIERNLALMRFRKDGKSISTHAFANFARRELSSAIRGQDGAYECSLVIAGIDESGEQKQETASLYYLDYLGTLCKVPYCSHGYGATFAMALLDRYYEPSMTQEAAIDLVKKCIREVQKRLIMQNANFDVKIVSSEGVEAMRIGLVSSEPKSREHGDVRMEATSA